jgi:hypothetical protein
MASKTCLAIFPDRVLSWMRLMSPANRSAGTGLEPISSPALFSVADSSPLTQLAASLASPQARATVSK